MDARRPFVQTARSSSHDIGDTEIFVRPRKTLGVEKGGKSRAARIDRSWGQGRGLQERGDGASPERLGAFVMVALSSARCRQGTDATTVSP